MLLDTSFLIDLQRELAAGRARGTARFLTQHAATSLWISLVTWMESAEGYPPDREEVCHLFRSGFALVLPDLAIAWRASQISRRLRATGSPIGDHDVWIAATALERGMPLVTRNPRHFRRVPDLRIFAY